MLDANPTMIKTFGHQSRETFLAVKVADLYADPATDKECQEIVERIATLELEKQPGSSDAKSVGSQVDETKKALAPNTMKDCVGKRITERAMQCVRGAKSSQQIVDDCFK